MATPAPQRENNFKVRLIPIASLMYGDTPAAVNSSQVVFEVTPTFTESGTVDYVPVTPVHMPGSIQTYRHTNSRTFDITAHFISRNVADARQNMDYLQRLRGWRFPYFGATDTLSKQQRGARSDQSDAPQPLSGVDRDANIKQRIQKEGIQLRGAPPDVLYLYAYSTGQNDARPDGCRVNINRVPVVMTNLSIVYPEDVDYIPVYVGSGPDDHSEPFPIKIDVTISLAETHSPREFEKFNLASFKSGSLVNF